MRRLSGYIWAQQIQNEEVTLETEYPADCWQHFKRRWFAGWMLRRWPVRMTTVKRRHTFRTVALLPDFKYKAPPNCGERYIIKTIVDSPRSFVPFDDGDDR